MTSFLFRRLPYADHPGRNQHHLLGRHHPGAGKPDRPDHGPQGVSQGHRADGEELRPGQTYSSAVFPLAQTFFTGKLYSFKDGRPVLEKIGERIWNTLLLNLVAIIIIFSLAIPLGIFSARRQYTFMTIWGRSEPISESPSRVSGWPIFSFWGRSSSLAILCSGCGPL